MEPEYLAATHAIKEAMWLGALLGEMGIRIGVVKLYCDNQGCISSLKNHLVSKHTTHIRVSYRHAREKVAGGQIFPIYIPSDENMADMFTNHCQQTYFNGIVQV